MLTCIGFLLCLRLIFAGYLAIKEFRTGHWVLTVDALRISRNYCLGPIFHLQSGSLCGKAADLALTPMSTQHRRILDFLRDNQTRLGGNGDCRMAVSKRHECPVGLEMSNARTLQFRAIIYLVTNGTTFGDFREAVDVDSSSSVAIVMVGVRDGRKLFSATRDRLCYASVMSPGISPLNLVVYAFLLGVVVFVVYSIYKFVRLFNRWWMCVNHFIKMKISLANLKIQRYKPGDNDESCSICLIEFASKTKIRKLLCGHGFHPKCIDHWIQSHKPTCPLCNFPVSIPTKKSIVKCTICSSVMSRSSEPTIQRDLASQNTVLTTEIDTLDNRQTSSNPNEQAEEEYQLHLRADSVSLKKHIPQDQGNNPGDNESILYQLEIINDQMLRKTETVVIIHNTVEDETI